MRFGVIRPPLPFFHPACLLATWFGSGLLRPAPGTMGSLTALPFAWLIALAGGPIALLAASLLIFAVGCWAAGIYESADAVKDPGSVVIDEVAGQWLALVPAPLDPIAYLVGFIAFRIADIVKPWPVSWADRSIGGGVGIMLDDMLAGLYALAAVLAWRHWMPV
jgi:phosphatidylglycerophosphatase A